MSGTLSFCEGVVTETAQPPMLGECQVGGIPPLLRSLALGLAPARRLVPDGSRR